MKMSKVLLRALLLPVFPAFGVPDAPADTQTSPTAPPPAGTSVPPSTPPAGGEQADQGKTFTQAEVNRMAAAEKEQGRRAVLKALGIPDDAKANEAIAQYKALADSQKSDLEKAQGTATAEAAARAVAETEAAALKNQLSAIKLGVNPSFVEDVMAIASAKVTDAKTFDAVVTEMKNNTAYAPFFAAELDASTVKPRGTGQLPATVKKPGENVTSPAARLAAQRGNNPQKSHYFN